MKWNLRMVAAQRDLWRPTEVLAAFQQVGFNPSLSKVAAPWSGTPVTARLDDLDKMCAASPSAARTATGRSSSRPLRRPTKNGLSVGVEWWTRLRKRRADPAGPPVPEAQVHGQIPLFTVPRVLGDTTVSAIVGWPVAGWEQTRLVIEAIEAEHGMAAAWRRKVAEMVRLALAVREAEGAERLSEAMLRDFRATGTRSAWSCCGPGSLTRPTSPHAVLHLRRPTRTPYITAPAPLPPRAPRQCTDCYAWIPARRRAGFVCDPCRHWRERTGRGRCCRCGRNGLALRDNRCRGCHPYRLLDEARPASRRFTQLVVPLPTDKGAIRWNWAARVEETGLAWRPRGQPTGT